MRCKCCDADNAKKYRDDYYCNDCAESIKETYKELKFVRATRKTYSDTPDLPKLRTP
jgi:hypothetical protein